MRKVSSEIIDECILKSNANCSSMHGVLFDMRELFEELTPHLTGALFSFAATAFPNNSETNYRRSIMPEESSVQKEYNGSNAK